MTHYGCCCDTLTACRTLAILLFVLGGINFLLGFLSFLLTWIMAALEICRGFFLWFGMDRLRSEWMNVALICGYVELVIIGIAAAIVIGTALIAGAIILALLKLIVDVTPDDNGVGEDAEKTASVFSGIGLLILGSIVLTCLLCVAGQVWTVLVNHEGKTEVARQEQARWQERVYWQAQNQRQPVAYYPPGGPPPPPYSLNARPPPYSPQQPPPPYSLDASIAVRASPASRSPSPRR